MDNWFLLEKMFQKHLWKSDILSKDAGRTLVENGLKDALINVKMDHLK